MSDQFVIEAIWERPGLPGIIGPFASKREAEKWGELNVSNGVWNVSPLAYPYLRAGARQERGDGE